MKKGDPSTIVLQAGTQNYPKFSRTEFDCPGGGYTLFCNRISLFHPPNLARSPFFRCADSDAQTVTSCKRVSENGLVKERNPIAKESVTPTSH